MEITGKTKVMFVLAHPIGHVRATAVLNAHFARAGHDIAASPLHVHPSDLEEVLRAIRRMRNVIGFGLTIPHKIAALAYLDSLTPEAEAAGASNFVRRNADGSLTGHNTDGLGFVAGLRAHGVEPHGLRVLQIGAGGAGHAVAAALAAEGVGALHIVNRDRRRAESLAGRLRSFYPGTTISTNAIGAGEADLIVNATSLGMKPDDPLPCDLDRAGPQQVVAEVVMTPPETRFLALAATRGCRTVPGRAMLDAQMDLVTRFLVEQPALA